MKLVVARRAVGPWLVGLALSAIGSASQAQDIPGYPEMIDAYDAREVAMLPPYCKHTQLFRDSVPGGNNREQINRWMAIFGPDMYQHMHHYCWGMMATNRAVILARSQRVRMSNLSRSISEFDYVIRHAKDDFVLLPEILARKGENLIRMGRGPMAIGELERAIELKPDYWAPYAHLADFYKEVGEIDNARSALERGLANAPDAIGLKRRLAELDRKGEAQKPARKARQEP